jgi:hypothetical protein
MTIRFAALCTVEVTHAYYGGVCRDFAFIIPAGTAHLLDGGRLIAKVLDGRLHVLFEVADEGGPLAPLSGATLRIGLKLRNPYFGNFTAIGFDTGSAIAVYRNSVNVSQLDAPVPAVRISQAFSHALADEARPVSVSVKDPLDRVVAAETVSAEHDRPSVSFDLSDCAPGLYTITETYPGNVALSTLADLDPELAREDVFGVVEITIAPALYAAPAAFQIAFDAREQTLKYYVVAKDYAGAEFDQLAVSDAGFTDEGRPEVTFTKVSAAGFSPADIPSRLLGNGDTRVVLFQSQGPVKRQGRGRQRIQLSRNGEVLVGNLPQPGADRSTSDVIVHLSKKP